MNPKQLLLDTFQQIVTPKLERVGFRFSRSQFCYKRPFQGFVQQISIGLNRHNSSEMMCFDSGFAIRSVQYKQWQQQQGRDSISDVVYGCSHWNIPDWEEGGAAEVWLDFTEGSRRAVVVGHWVECCERWGLPFLDRASSWSSAAELLHQQGGEPEEVADLYRIGGDIRRAVASMEAAVRVLVEQDFPYSEETHPVLVQKRLRQAAERDLKVSRLHAKIAAFRVGEQSHSAYFASLRL